MNFSLFENLIEQTICHNWYVNLGAFAIFLFGTIALLLKYRKFSKQMVQTKKKAELNMLMRRRDRILLGIVCGIIVTPSFIVSPAILSCRAKRDINQQQYVQVEAYFTHDSISDRERLLTNGEIEIIVDGETIKLKLPYGWKREEILSEDGYIDVWYSWESKIILSANKVGES